jgi:hypothetical protein
VIVIGEDKQEGDSVRESNEILVKTGEIYETNLIGMH